MLWYEQFDAAEWRVVTLNVEDRQRLRDRYGDGVSSDDARLGPMGSVRKTIKKSGEG